MAIEDLIVNSGMQTWRFPEMISQMQQDGRRNALISDQMETSKLERNALNRQEGDASRAEQARQLYRVFGPALQASDPAQRRQLLSRAPEIMGPDFDDDDRRAVDSLIASDDNELDLRLKHSGAEILKILGMDPQETFGAFETVPGAPEGTSGQRNNLTGKYDNLQTPDKPDRELLEVGDETSPTGTRYVRRSEASGMPGKPPSGGLDIQFGPDGKPLSITTGGKGKGKNATGLTPSTATDVQGKVLSLGDTQRQVAAIGQTFKPEYQQIGTRWRALATSWKDKAGGDVPAADKQMLTDFTTYRSNAAQLFSSTLKELSGGAVTPQEFERAQAWLPTPGTGLFDGDSPTVLKSKLDRYGDFTRKAVARYTYINKHGLSIEDIEIDQMPRFIQARGDELAAEAAKSGLTGAQLKQTVKAQLADEFGLSDY